MNRSVDPDRSRFASASADESAVADAMELYMAELEAGHPPDRAEFLARFPELADSLEIQLKGLELLHGVAPQARAGKAAGRDLDDDLIATRGTLGDFRLIRQIGRGGMGVVYEAEQISLARRVAVKVLPFAAMLDEQHRKRFQNEARAAATLDHPHIVPIHLVGQERGVHFYAMQLIDGQSLAELITDLRNATAADPLIPSPSPPQSRGRRVPKSKEPKTKELESKELKSKEPESKESDSRGPKSKEPELKDTAANFRSQISTARSDKPDEFFRTVARFGAEAAEALDHAHRVGILHRDIKPGNLLVDTSGKLWVADFGLATIETAETLTRSGGIVGTAAYMSPEQALDSHRIDGRADLYALGATLYELLTLRSHRAGKTVISTAGDAGPSAIGRPSREVANLPVDLETIVMKALQYDADDRYETAGAMASDLRAYLDGREIKARRLTLLQRQVRFLRRHSRWAAAALAASFLLVLAFGSVMWVYSRQLSDKAKQLETALAEKEQSRLRAEEQSALARRNEAEARQHALLAQQNEQRAQQNERRARESELHARRISYRRDMQQAFEHFDHNRWFEAAALIQRQRPSIDDRDIRGAEWGLLKAQFDARYTTLGWHDGAATECVLYPDGNTAATAGEDGKVQLWDLDERSPIASFAPGIGAIHAMAISPDGQTLAVGGAPSTVTFGFALVHLLDARSGMRRKMIQRHVRTIESIRFSPDGKLIAAGSRYKSIQLSTVDGDHLHSIDGKRRNTSIEFSPDSNRLLTSWTEPDMVRLLDCQTGQQLPIQFGIDPGNGVGCIRWPTKSRFVVITGDRQSWADAFDPKTGKSLCALHIPGFIGVPAVAISPAGSWIAAGDAQGRVHLFEVAESKWRKHLRKQQRPAFARSALPPLSAGNQEITSIVCRDDRSIVTTHTSGRVQLLCPDQHAADLRTLDVEPTAITVAADCSVYVATKGSVFRYEVKTGQREQMFSLGEDTVAGMAISGDAARLAMVYQSGRVEVIDVRDATTLFLKPGDGSATNINFHVAISEDGRYVARTGDDDQTVVWNIDHGTEVFQQRHPQTGHGRAVALAADGSLVALGNDHVNLYRVSSGERINRYRLHRPDAIQFSPDGNHMASGHTNGSTLLLNLENFGQWVDRYLIRPVGDVSFSPDSQTIFSVVRYHEKPRIRITDVASGEPYGALHAAPMVDGNRYKLPREIIATDQRLILVAPGNPVQLAVWDISR